MAGLSQGSHLLGRRIGRLRSQRAHCPLSYHHHHQPEIGGLLHGVGRAAKANASTSTSTHAAPKPTRSRRLLPTTRAVAVEEETFAATLAETIDLLPGASVVEHSELRPALLSRALLDAGAAEVIKAANPKAELKRAQLNTDLASGVCGDVSFRHVDTNLFERWVDVDYTALVGQRAPAPWEADEPTDLLLVTVLPYYTDRPSILSWAFMLGSRVGLFRWGRVPAYFAVPTVLAQAMMAGGADCPEYGRVSVLLAAQADMAHLGQLPPIDGDAPLELVRMVPKRHVDFVSVHWLNYCLRRLLVRKTSTLGQAARTLAPGSKQWLAAADLDPRMDIRALTVDDHIRLANALSQSPHRPDLDLTESMPFR